MRRNHGVVSLSLGMGLCCAVLAGEGAAPPAAKAVAEIAAQSFPYEGEVTARRVYLRAGDGINYTILTVANPGDRVQVRQERFDWLAIAVPRTCTVWVHKSFLAAAADGKTATATGDRVNIRARAQATADVLGQLPQGTVVRLVDTDGDWCGIEPPPQATAWVHSKFVRRATGPAPPTPPDVATPPGKEGPGLADAKSWALLRDAEMLYNAELAKPAKQRDFTDILAAYQKVAGSSTNPDLARRAEQTRQRLLKIIDLHKALEAAREPLERFDEKYRQLEQEYRQRAGVPAEKKSE